MLGMTWATTLDAALDEIARLQTERDNALDSMLELTKKYPWLERDEHFMHAVMALQ